MKKYLLVFLVTIVFVLETFSQVNPKCDECLPNWNNLSSFTFTFMSILDISITVEYKTRICNGFQEIRIIKITSNQSGGFVNYHPREIMSVVMMYIFRENPLNFTTGFWRISKISCWHYINTPPNTILEPCITCDNYCCFDEYIAYNTECDGFSFILTGTVGTSDCEECPGAIENGCMNLCF